MEKNFEEKQKSNPDYMIKQMKFFIKENRVTFDKRAKNIGMDLLNQNITDEQRVDVLSCLCTIAIRNGRANDAKKYGEEALEYDVPEEKKQAIKQKLQSIKNSTQNHMNIGDYRNKLYSGEIDCEDLKKLVEENNKTIQSYIFIAETCKYLELEHLGIQSLKGFSKNNLELKNHEQKAISQAMEILKRKKINPIIREEWDKVYNMTYISNKIEVQKNEIDR